MSCATALRSVLLHSIALCSISTLVGTFANDVTEQFDDIACSAATQPRVLTDYSGSFTSPNYPSPYPSLSNCQWLILSQEPDGAVKLDFDVIWTNMYADRVTIYDGNTTQAPVITAFDDTTNWDPIARNVLSSGPSLLVVFVSVTENTAFTGFSASFTSVPQVLGEDPCYALTRPLLLPVGSGRFQSNGFPVSYWNNANCQWLIQITEEYNVVELTFPYFRTETDYDYVYLYDGNSASSPLIASIHGKYSGAARGPFLSTGRSMFVQFTSDGIVLETGFNATYSPRAPTECGTVLTPAPNTAVVGQGFDHMCYLEPSNVLYRNATCYQTVKNLFGIGDADSLVSRGGNFGCLLSGRDDFVGAENACYDSYQWSASLGNCPTCTKLLVCLRLPKTL